LTFHGTSFRGKVYGVRGIVEKKTGDVTKKGIFPSSPTNKRMGSPRKGRRRGQKCDLQVLGPCQVEVSTVESNPRPKRNTKGEKEGEKRNPLPPAPQKDKRKDVGPNGKKTTTSPKETRRR